MIAQIISPWSFNGQAVPQVVIDHPQIKFVDVSAQPADNISVGMSPNTVICQIETDDVTMNAISQNGAYYVIWSE